MRIGIIGFGLIGGSIAKAFKEVHAQNSYIIGYDVNSSYLEAALADNVIDKLSTTIGADFSNCNVIFICTPIGDIVSIVKKLIPFVSKDCILTDIGSTKYDLVKSIHNLLDSCDKNIYFIGGHPMAGSEKSGYFASTPHLFENAYYILTPASDTPDFILFILQRMIERLGALPIILSPSYHDFATATVSHLPHIIASGLVHLVKNSDGNHKHLHTLAAGGFKDITRIASSSATVWQHICLSNKEQLQKSFKNYVAILNGFIEALDANDEKAIYDFFEESKAYRDTFKDGVASDIAKNYTLYVDAKDEPGIIASIATLLSSHRINIKDIGIMNHREFACGVLRVAFATKNDMLEAQQLLSRHNYTIYY